LAKPQESASVCRTDARKTSEKAMFVEKKPDCSGSHGSWIGSSAVAPTDS